MTAERFTVDSDGKYWDTVSKKYVTITHLFYLVEKLEKENEQLKRKNTKWILDYNGLNAEYEWLKEENEQLKQRNTNQYNQLNELWQIIEEENWEKLIIMKKQLKEDEERLQSEWKCYE